jgi:hypothetical protein
VHTFAESRGGSPVSAQSAYDGFRAAFSGRSEVLVSAFQGDAGNATVASGPWLPAALRVSRGAFTRCLTRAGYPVLDFEVEAVFSDLCRLADGAIYWPEFVDLVCPELAGLPSEHADDACTLHDALLMLIEVVGVCERPGAALLSVSSCLSVCLSVCLCLFICIMPYACVMNDIPGCIS